MVQVRPLRCFLARLQFFLFLILRGKRSDVYPAVVFHNWTSGVACALRSFHIHMEIRHFFHFVGISFGRNLLDKKAYTRFCLRSLSLLGATLVDTLIDASFLNILSLTQRD